jgi:hypothetical protein
MRIEMPRAVAVKLLEQLVEPYPLLLEVRVQGLYRERQRSDGPQYSYNHTLPKPLDVSADTTTHFEELQGIRRILAV